MKSKHVPMRRCVGCNISEPKDNLLRFVLNESEDLYVPDIAKNAEGRGVYIHKDSPDCLVKAVKRKRREFSIPE